MRFIGVTGGVGAGKSEILSFIKNNYNSRVMLADEIAHELMEPGGACYQDVVELLRSVIPERSQGLLLGPCEDVLSWRGSFEPSEATSELEPRGASEEKPVECEGIQLFLPNGSFNRPALAKILFSDPALRDRLNGIVHPAVKQYVIDEAKKERERGALDILVLEAALLIEEGYGEICDELWYIYTSEETRRQRLKASRGYSDEKTDAIMNSQLSEEEFRRACKFVIDNNGTPEEAFSQIKKYLGE